MQLISDIINHNISTQSVKKYCVFNGTSQQDYVWAKARVRANLWCVCIRDLNKYYTIHPAHLCEIETLFRKKGIGSFYDESGRLWVTLEEDSYMVEEYQTGMLRGYVLAESLAKIEEFKMDSSSIVEFIIAFDKGVPQMDELVYTQFREYQKQQIINQIYIITNEKH